MRCKSPRCKGECVEVLVRYGDHLPLVEEYECMKCKKSWKKNEHKEKRNNFRPKKSKKADWKSIKAGYEKETE
jgi:hypothetical protein